MRRRRVAIVPLACALVVGACARAPAAVSADASGIDAMAIQQAPQDTLRGTIQVVGSEPATWVVLQRPGQRAVTLLGRREELAQVAELEVVVRGTAAGDRFHVQAFRVRAAHGVPAVDGVLERADGGAVLVTADGQRLLVRHLPEALRDQFGSRLWIAGPLDRPPDTFGVIRSR